MAKYRPRMAGQVICTEHLHLSAVWKRASEATEEEREDWQKELKSCEEQLRVTNTDVDELKTKLKDLKVLINYNTDE